MLELTEEQVKTIWRRRRDNAVIPSNLGSTPKYCFDYNALFSNERESYAISFDSDNWQDPLLADFRALIDDVRHDEDLPGYILKQNPDKYAPFSDIYRHMDINNPIQLYVRRHEDQTSICFIHTKDDQAFVCQRYKSRGRIEAFFDMSDVNWSIDLLSFTEILIHLGLESI